MPLQILHLNEFSDETLSRAVDSGPGGVFYHRELLRIWEQVYRWKSVVATDGEGFLVGFEKSTSLGKMFYSLPFGWYGGIVGGSSEGQFRSDVMKWLAEQKYLQINIVQFSPDPTALPTEGYEVKSITTHVLDLAHKSDYSENTIRNLRKAAERGLQVERLAAGSRGDFLNCLREHIVRTEEKRKLSEKFYLSLFDIAMEYRDHVKAMAVVLDDQLMAVHLYFTTATDVFYFDGFSTQPGLDSAANFLIFDQVINSSRSKGRLRLNFGASPEGDSGLVRFKEGWGAKPVLYHEYSIRALRMRIADRFRGRS